MFLSEVTVTIHEIREKIDYIQQGLPIQSEIIQHFLSLEKLLAPVTTEIVERNFFIS